ncbi:MAG: lamin tail domain-containing protein, partial [Candidatus Thermoplasmatota archaeon]|nr:lamin tail domain-containing protein [Candidatus Thermoplasmatota archaeon]
MHQKSKLTGSKKKNSLIVAIFSTFLLMALVFFLVASPNAQNIPNHVVISEVFYNCTDDNQFIELYNPTSEDISLDGWNLSHYNESGTFLWSVELDSGHIIAAYSYYLIGQQDNISIPGWGNVTSDANFTNKKLEDGPDDYLVLYDETDSYIDGVRWGHDAGNNPPPLKDVPGNVYVAPLAGDGKSIQRHTIVYNISEPYGPYELWARCQDTDNNSRDFFSSSSTPFNSTKSSDPAPVFKIVGDPHILIAPDEYYVTNSTPIYLNISDDLVGKWTLYYRVFYNGGYVNDTNITINQTSPNITIYFSDNCTHYLEYFVKNFTTGDRYPKTGWDNETFYVDNLPPVTNMTLGAPNHSSSFINFSTPIYLNTTDMGCNGGAGNYTIYYRIWNETHGWDMWQNGTPHENEDLTLYITDECKHYIQYFALDILGNNDSGINWGNVNNRTVFVDNTPPNSSVDTFTSYEQDNVPFWVNVTASDDEGCPPGSGIVTVELWYRYSTDNSTWSPYISFGTNDTDLYQWPFDAPNDSGYYEFYSIGIDSLGQKEDAPIEADARCNVTAPITRKHHSGPFWTVGDKDYITSSTEFNFTVDDPDGDPSNVIIRYRWWWNGNWMEWKNYTGNFTMSGNCKHYLEYYAYEPNGTTEHTRNQTYWLDDNAPTSSYAITSGPVRGEYINTNTTITLTGQDASGTCNAGEWRIWYRKALSGLFTPGDWNTSVDVQYSEECSHYLQWYAEDRLGNEESVHTQIFKVDTTPPVSSLSVSGPYVDNNWVRSTSVIQLTATDVGGTCHVEEWKIVYRTWREGAGWTDWQSGNWNTDATIQFNQACKHYIEWYAVDRVYNQESPIRNKTLWVDLSPPVTTPQIHGTSISGAGFTWIRQSTYITLNVVDEGCMGGVGVDKTYFRYEYGGTSHPLGPGDNEYGTPVNIGGTWYWVWVGQQSQKIQWSQDCVHTLYYYSIDKLTNTETVKSSIFRVDDTPPTSSKTIGTPKYPTSGSDAGEWVTTSTPITLTANDPGTCAVGDWRIHWEIYMGSSLINSGTGNVNAPVVLTFDEECEHTLKWWAEDALGNLEDPHTQIHYVDDTPPNTSSLLAIGTPNHEEAGSVWVTTATQISLDSTIDPDGGCNGGVGLDSIQYRISKDPENDGWDGDDDFVEQGWTTYTGPFTMPSTCHHKLEWYGVDELGNQETPINVQQIYVDNTDPSSAHNYGSPSVFKHNQWYLTTSTPIYISATDLFIQPPSTFVDNSGQGIGTIMGVSPTSQTVFTYHTFTIDVKLYPDEPVTGAQFELVYDPAVLALTNIVAGDMFYGFNTYQYTNITAGKGVFAATILGGGSTQNDGTLATLEFTALNQEAAPTLLQLTKVVVGLPDGTQIPSPTINNGEVTILNSCDVGIYRIYYQVEENGLWSEWQNGTFNEDIMFYMPSECHHRIRYYAVDILGNQESSYTSSLFSVDDTPP